MLVLHRAFRSLSDANRKKLHCCHRSPPPPVLLSNAIFSQCVLVCLLLRRNATSTVMHALASSAASAFVTSIAISPSHGRSHRRSRGRSHGRSHGRKLSNILSLPPALSETHHLLVVAIDSCVRSRRSNSNPRSRKRHRPRTCICTFVDSDALRLTRSPEHFSSYCIPSATYLPTLPRAWNELFRNSPCAAVDGRSSLGGRQRL